MALPLKILTRVEKGRAHRETSLSIDWEGVTPKQMEVMALGFVIYSLQCRWRKEGKIPETCDVMALEFAQEEVPYTEHFRVPEAWTKSDASNQLDKMLKGLSKEELATLFETL